MPVVDTSFLVALFNVEDAHHAKATKQAAAAATLIVPSPVLVEFLQVVYYQSRRAHGEADAAGLSRRACRQLVAIASVRVEVDYGHDKAQAIFLANKKLTFVDAAGLHLARAMRDELYSFDKEQLAVWKAPAFP